MSSFDMDRHIDTLPVEPEEKWYRSRPEVMTYLELRRIYSQVATLQAEMRQALNLTQTVLAQEARIRELELAQASSKGSVDVWRRVFDLIWGLGLALIGAKVWDLW